MNALVDWGPHGLLILIIVLGWIEFVLFTDSLKAKNVTQSIVARVKVQVVASKAQFEQYIVKHHVILVVIQWNLQFSDKTLSLLFPCQLIFTENNEFFRFRIVSQID